MKGEVWLIAIGIVLVLEGMPYLIAPGGMKRFFSQMQEIPEGRLRLLGSCAILAGLGLIAWLRFSG